MPGVLCLVPDRNADKCSSLVIGCSSRSAYFVGQVSGMTPCGLVTYFWSIAICWCFRRRCVTKVRTLRWPETLLPCISSIWRMTLISRRLTILRIWKGRVPHLPFCLEHCCPAWPSQFSLRVSVLFWLYTVGLPVVLRVLGCRSVRCHICTDRGYFPSAYSLC